MCPMSDREDGVISRRDGPPENPSAADVPDGIRFNTWLPLGADQTWQVLTKAEHLKNWFGDHISLDATLGGFFREIWWRDGQEVQTFGQVLKLQRPHLIVMTWSDEDWQVETELELRLTPILDGTLFTLTHSGWRDLDLATAARVRRDHEAGWKRHITSLETYCRTGLNRQDNDVLYPLGAKKDLSPAPPCQATAS